MFHVKPMRETVEKCPVCGSNELVKDREVKDYSTSKEVFDIQLCTECSHRFTSPRPVESEIGPYYDNPDYISHTDEDSSFFGKLYQRLRNVNLGWKKAHVAKTVPAGRLLDYGCGTGQFLQYMSEVGYHCSGVEINEGAREKASKFGEVHASLEPLSGSFDAITLWHVLEHVYDLPALLSAFKKLLDHEGTLLIAVPNPESPDAVHYGSHWAAWDVPIHVHHFTKKSMSVLMEANGFEVVDVLPMKLDSYYISLLSQQYKSGAPSKSAVHWIKGAWYGLLSNTHAGKTNTSSLIYRIRHKND